MYIGIYYIIYIYICYMCIIYNILYTLVIYVKHKGFNMLYIAVYKSIKIVR